MMAAIIGLRVHFHLRAAARFHHLRHQGLRGDDGDGDRRRGQQTNQKSQGRTHRENVWPFGGQLNNILGRSGTQLMLMLVLVLVIVIVIDLSHPLVPKLHLGTLPAYEVALRLGAAPRD